VLGLDPSTGRARDFIFRMHASGQTASVSLNVLFGVPDWRLHFLAQTLKRRAFFVVARVCFGLYRTFPLFGPLRASVAVIHREHKILVIQRNDGRGMSLPGGIAGRREAEEVTLRREVREETGLTVTHAELQMTYYTGAEVPCNISVFRAEATGELTESWEGTPRWMTLEDLEPRLIKSQRPVLELMNKIAAEWPSSSTTDPLWRRTSGITQGAVSAEGAGDGRRED
jgi:8-oxo-dGTP diphosphatase